MQNIKNIIQSMQWDIVPKFDVELKNYTTFRIGGRCDVLMTPSNIMEYISILNLCYDSGMKFWLLGGGSNLLVDSGGISGVVISTQKLQSIVVSGGIIRAECGVRLIEVSNQAKINNLGGMEFCAGIPGTIGGAVVGNAGAFGGDMSKIVKSVTFWQNGEVKKVKNKKNLFNYRKSVFKNDTSCAIIDVDMLGHRDSEENIRRKIESNMEYRKRTQSVGYSNAGCVFNNTEIPPAIMIEKSGLKGYRIGDAMVSHKHSNFVVNLGNATSGDVLELIKNIKEKIYNDWGKKLDVEIVYWGNENV